MLTLSHYPCWCGSYRTSTTPVNPALSSGRPSTAVGPLVPPAAPLPPAFAPATAMATSGLPPQSAPPSTQPPLTGSLHARPNSAVPLRNAVGHLPDKLAPSGLGLGMNTALGGSATGYTPSYSSKLGVALGSGGPTFSVCKVSPFRFCWPCSRHSSPTFFFVCFSLPAIDGGCALSSIPVFSPVCPPAPRPPIHQQRSRPAPGVRCGVWPGRSGQAGPNISRPSTTACPCPG